jgi:thioredoxin-related protein
MEGSMRLRIEMAVVALTLGSLQAVADIPSAYSPLPVEAPFAFSERVFDLTPAVERARAEKKLLFVYFGAKNCPYCKAYERFLSDHQAALGPVYGQHVLADIRTYITGPDVYFKVGEKKYSFREFAAIAGDANGRTTYPRFWLLTADLKPARKMPQGSTAYRNLEEHKRLIARPS